MTSHAAAALALGLSVGLVAGCSDSVKPGPRAAPQDPETELTYAPLDSDTTSYRVRFYWSGHDGDGEVIRFSFAIDADTSRPLTEWSTTTAKDTTFTFLVDPITEVRQHVFMISSVDNSGRYDRSPARRFFSAKTLPPSSKIERGPAPFNPPIGPTFAFEWSGRDPDGSHSGGPAPVDSFEYLLLLLGEAAEPGHPPLPPFDQSFYVRLINEATGRSLPAPYDDWEWVGLKGEKRRFESVAPGEYVFAVRAVDVAGASEKSLKFGTNIRHFTVIPRDQGPYRIGPVLTVSSSLTRRPISPPAQGPNDAPRSPIRAFEQELVSFSWQASADGYGGEIVGYSYALDELSALPDLDPLATGVTFARADLPPGNHFLCVRAVDNGGLITNAVIPILILRPSFKDPGAPREILYVDDSMGPGNTRGRIGNFPSDVEETNWWTLDLLPNLGVPYTEWDTFIVGAGDVEGRRPPGLGDLARFSTIIWNVDFNNSGANPTALYKTLIGEPDTGLAAYLRAGGTLILTGFSIGSNTCEPRTTLYAHLRSGICAALAPGSLTYDLAYFPRLFMGVDGARDNAQGLRTLGARDFIAAVATPAGVAAGYDSAKVDLGPLGSGAKWITYPGGDPNTNTSPGLPQVDGWVMAKSFGCEPAPGWIFVPEDVSRAIAEPILTYHGANVGIDEEGGPSPREGMVVGIQVQAYSLGALSGGYPGPSFDPNSSTGRMVHFGFPLYFLRNQDALHLLRRAFDFVDASPTLP